MMFGGLLILSDVLPAEYRRNPGMPRSRAIIRPRAAPTDRAHGARAGRACYFIPPILLHAVKIAPGLVT
jgi:hypothetical protein